MLPVLETFNINNAEDAATAQAFLNGCVQMKSYLVAERNRRAQTLNALLMDQVTEQVSDLLHDEEDLRGPLRTNLAAKVADLQREKLEMKAAIAWLNVAYVEADKKLFAFRQSQLNRNSE